MKILLTGRRDLWVYAVLTLVTLAVYWQVGHHDFVNFDDQDYVTENYIVQKGLTLEGLSWALTTGHASNWHPLTWLSHMLDCQLFGLNPGAQLLTNVFFHIASTLLLFGLLHKMTKALWQSAFVAALFALHPLHVESVAWLSERKDVLSTFFWMLTTLAYVFYVEHPNLKRYVLVLLSFTLGLLAKPMVVTLPFVLLLMDYWPLRRFHFGPSEQIGKPQDRKSSKPRSSTRIILKLIREKVPLFLLSVASSAVTYIVQQRGGAVSTFEGLPFNYRLGNAFIAFLRYLQKMLWPSGLAVFYPHPGSSLQLWQVLVAGFLLVCVSALVIWSLRRRPYLTVGWLWYLGTLIPVIGLVQVGGQSIADRYTYVPLIGIFIIIAWGAPELFGRTIYRRIGLPVVAGLLILASLSVTWFQVQVWQNSFVLYEHALAVTKDNQLAHNNLGVALFNAGKIGEAIPHYHEVLRLAPNNADGHNSLGLALSKQGKTDEAISHLSEAVRLNPKYAQAHYNLGVVLAGQGKNAEAMTHYSEALRLKPGYVDAYMSIGFLLAKEGKKAEAISQYSEAIRINPNHADAHLSLGYLLAEQGKGGEAIDHFTEALRNKPNDADLRNDLGNVLAANGRDSEAITQYSEALRIKPELWNAHYNLGLVYSRQGKYAEAITHYSDALRINPNDAQSHYGLGVALTKEGKIADAITHLSEALRIRPDYAEAKSELDKALQLQKQPKSLPQAKS